MNGSNPEHAPDPAASVGRAVPSPVPSATPRGSDPIAQDVGGEYDSLADLFLGPGVFSQPPIPSPAPLPVLAPAAGASTVTPAASTPAAHGPSTPRAELAAGPHTTPRSPLPHSATALPIEVVVLGHLPVRASVWVRQHAAARAAALGRPVGLIRLGPESTTIDLIGADADRVRQRGADAPAAIKAAAGTAGAWIIRAEGDAEDLVLGDARLTRVTVLTGADEAAVVASYRLLKSLAMRLDESHAGSIAPGRGPSIHVVVMGSSATDAAAAGERLRKAVGSFLTRPVRVSVGDEKITSITSTTLFHEQVQADHATLLDVITPMPPAGGVAGSPGRLDGPALRLASDQQPATGEPGASRDAGFAASEPAPAETSARAGTGPVPLDFDTMPWVPDESAADSDAFTTTAADPSALDAVRAAESAVEAFGLSIADAAWTAGITPSTDDTHSASAATTAAEPNRPTPVSLPEPTDEARSATTDHGTEVPPMHTLDIPAAIGQTGSGGAGSGGTGSDGGAAAHRPSAPHAEAFGLAALVSGSSDRADGRLVTLESRCPTVPGVELAADGHGVLHILASDVPIDGVDLGSLEVGSSSRARAVDRVLAAAGWARAHLPLLIRAEPSLAQPSSVSSGTPVLHVVVGDARVVRTLLDSDLRLHLARAVDVRGERVWICDDLN